MSYYRIKATGEVLDFEPTTENPDNIERLTNKAGKAAFMAQARDKLRRIMPPGTRVYCTLRHVSRSGMMRHISLAIVEDGSLRDITWLAACAMDDRVANNGGIKIGGCGMDMGFALVYSLGRALYPQGFGIEGELPDARRVRGFRKVRAKTPAGAARLVAKGAKFRGRNGDSTGWDNDGGYAFRREWC